MKNDAKGKTIKPLLETRIAFLALGLVLVFAALDWGLAHPGLSFSNDLKVPEDLQAWAEGAGLRLMIGSGILLIIPQKIFSLMLTPCLAALHLPVMLMFLGECGLLWWLGKRLFSERAGAWAVLACALAAFTWLRVRNVVAYCAVPPGILVLLASVLLVKSRKAAFLAGLAAGFFCLDYDAWILALPGLACAQAQESPAPRKLLPAWLAGLLAGGLAALWIQWPYLADYVVQRRGLTLPKGGSRPGPIFWPTSAPFCWAAPASPSSAWTSTRCFRPGPGSRWPRGFISSAERSPGFWSWRSWAWRP